VKKDQHGKEGRVSLFAKKNKKEGRVSCFLPDQRHKNGIKILRKHTISASLTPLMKVTSSSGGALGYEILSS
jgi:hypothetical protein